LLNKIWAFLVVAGILFGIGSALYNVQHGEKITKTVDGKQVTHFVTYTTFAEKVKAFAALGDRLTKSAINSAAFEYEDPDTGKKRSGALGIVVGITGLMMIWLGFMKIAELSGLISLLAQAIAPLFRFLFPKVPVDHPAAGAVMMNVAANMLGLDNAATPLGIKAMRELQTLNGKKDTASNAMCMFLALNTSSLTLLPATVIGYRIAAKSTNPTEIIVPILIATGCGKLAAIISCKILEKFTPDTPSAEPIPSEVGSNPEVIA
jgi:spore maturation protein A